MLDVKSVTEMVEQQINIAVENQVSMILRDVQWMDEIEAKIIRHIQDRITSRFANLSTMPDVVAAIESSVGKLIDQGQLPGIDSYIDQAKVTQAIDSSVQDLVKQSIDNLVVDPAWLDKIELIVNQNMASKVGERISGIDINSVVVAEVERNMLRWQQSLLDTVKTHGIADVATKNQLTVMDDAVVIETGLTSKSFMTETDADVQGTLTVQNLVVKGTVNTDNRSWHELIDYVANHAADNFTAEWRRGLTEDVIALAKEQGIDFKDVSINGQPLITDNVLNSNITESKLTKLGTLSSLSVSGTASIGDTVLIKNKRMGINTQDPEMALSVWDEEVNLLSGKFSKNTAYIGTGRKQNLSIGVNRTPYLTIDEDGLTTVQKFRIDKFNIGHATQVPGYSGQRGDFIINSDPKPGAPFAWLCLGGFRWQALKSAE